MIPIVPLLAAALALWYGYRQLKKPKLPLPPGPPQHWLPFIGNAIQIMNAKVPFPCLLAEWRELYGDIYSFTVLGQTTIVVNTAADAKELFDLRSTVYNSRPSLPLLRDYLCKRANIAFEPYGDSWRRHRRAVHHELNVRDVNQYAHIQDREAYMLAQGFLDHPQHEKLLTILQRFSGSIGLGALYDHRVDSYSDPLIEEFSFVLEGKLALLQPGASFYDYLPWFREAPDWLMPSKKRARAAREKGEVLDLKMSQIVQERVNNGDGSASFHSGLLEREREGKAELTPFERDSLSGTLVGAAVDTTTAGMHSLVCAWIKFPEVQRKLQAEIDSVVGRERMPNVHDIPNLPYTRAFVREALRWRSVARFSLPHATSEADTYKGFYIPKGATIIGNSWCMEHDKNFFPDHETVRPERYLTEDGSTLNDTPVYGFGFGRRVCPGQAMALTSMSLATACLMWAFDFGKAKDASGQVMEPDASPENCHDGGNVFRINPFPYVVSPRSESGNVEQMVRSTVAATF